MRHLLHALRLLPLLSALAGMAAHGQATRTPLNAAAEPGLVRGEIVEVDEATRRVLVKHGPIRNLGMDAMTMEFLVPDGEPLPVLKPGDRVRFAAGWRSGEYVMTRIVTDRRAGPAASPRK